MSDFKPISEMNCFSRQKIFFPALPLKTDIEIELINIMKDRGIITLQNGGAYLPFAALFLSPLENPKIQEGDVVILHIPYRCFSRAIDDLGMFKKKWVKDAGNDNAYIKFTKPNHMSIKIIEFERRKESIELNEKAEKIMATDDYPSALRHKYGNTQPTSQPRI
jgi:hypothetical protein